MAIKQMTRIAIFSALCVVLRIAFSSLPNIQPITALFFVISLYFGLSEAILVMTITMFTSSFLLGFGPWIFWQILSFSIILMIWKILIVPLFSKFKFERVIKLLLQSLILALLAFCYGLLIDSFFAYIYSMPWWSYVLAGFIYNIGHALSTGLFYPILVSIFRRFKNEKIY
ncbi:hypothetical protein HMPREF9318_00736 [Streptococcus urinalis FB127-CNA-2]|uniref:ECF transporter S component n=1 Tax=Streptococcus urinalis 2285-97 TaxID=764291 RepID=G5KHI1_9STRE|nr:ECF transporter S component [Streptococcus urinalis]EHJ57263.1 hypothetical protein STRUR_1496 [Streptococcus urinalis 2285-97]EKS22538.1 hypothetical protein HMPREF9318_00736 [Streptococcus urinalis FB127-CNA-2]VEF32351.1 Substrate-specific component CbrT of predicted cobalamin ECF transporter [Streptococcus urinalis]